MRNRLHHDQRGAILIVALVMGAVLAGACMHLFDIHRAISQREHAQSVADALAGEGAYWHAQGMNLIALVNICMALILSVFVLLRAIQLVAVTVAIIAIFVPGGAGFAAQAARFAEQALAKEQKYAPKMMKALAWGTKGERAIAAAFPYLALAASAIKDAPQGFAWSPSLFPTAPDRLLSRKVAGGAINTFPTRMGGNLVGADSAAVGQLQSRSKLQLAGLLVGSLPVEEEDYYQLCSRASEQLASFAQLGRIPYIKEAIGMLGGNLPWLMCQPVSEAKNIIEKQIGSQAKKGAETQCAADEATWRADELRRIEEARRGAPVCDRMLDWCKRKWEDFRGRTRPPPDPKWSDAERKKCRSEKEKKLKDDAQAKANELEKTQQASTDDIKTAKLWSLVNGDEDGTMLAAVSPILHVWSHHSEPALETSPGWVDLIPKTPDGKPYIDVQLPSIAFEPNVSSAKAAYYYNCVEKDDVKFRTCFDNSMWNLRWRYVLGVDRDAGQELQQLLGDSVRGLLGYGVGQGLSFAIGKVLGSFAKRTDGWQTDRANPAVKIDPDALWLRRLTATLTQQRSGKIHWAFWLGPNTADKYVVAPYIYQPLIR
jgi:hypothetical protein